MLECANTENCRQAKIIAVGSKDIVFDKTAIILHMLEDPGMSFPAPSIAFLIRPVLSFPFISLGRAPHWAQITLPRKSGGWFGGGSLVFAMLDQGLLLLLRGVGLVSGAALLPAPV